MKPIWLQTPIAPLSEDMRGAALARQNVLTKPAGALGRLEDIAVRLAAMQASATPKVERVHIVVFAGDHGVAQEGVSAFPQAVTGEMVKNFARGGAAISVVAKQLGASLDVVNLGTVNVLDAMPGVIDGRLGAGTANFTQTAAMTEHQVASAFHAGRHAVERARLAGAHLFIGGEMGIGNTTAAAAIACALLDAAPEKLAGPGTGIDAQGVAKKVAVLKRALTLHRDYFNDDWEILRRLGGFEIAALAGAYVSCAQIGIPVLIDGYISTAAALTAERLSPGTSQWMLFSHASAEPGHARMLEAMQAKPLLDFGMRLGEGSGAAVTVPLLKIACALHNEMATFADAGVSNKKV